MKGAKKLRAQTIEKVVSLTREDKAFDAALHDWHERKIYLSPKVADKTYDDWLRTIIVDLAGNIGIVMKPFNPDPSGIAMALRINAIGDDLALEEAHLAAEDGFESDANSYVEEGVVNSNVWIRIADPDKTLARAKDICASFSDSGYSAEIVPDPGDARGATVMATIDFPVYASLKVCHDLIGSGNGRLCYNSRSQGECHEDRKR